MLTTIFKPAADVVAASDDNGIVLHTGKGRVFTAGKIGISVWRGVEEGLSSAAIATEVSLQHGISSLQARGYVDQILVQLERGKFIEPAGGP